MLRYPQNTHHILLGGTAMGWAHSDQTPLGHSASSHYISRPMPIRSLFPSCAYWESVSQLCSASRLLLSGNRRQRRRIKI